MLSAAKAKAASALADEWQAIRNISRELQSAHPDNQYIATVLTDAEETVLDKKLYNLWDRASCTASYIKKKFNEHAKQWRLESRLYKYQAQLYESLFPDLSEYAVGEVDAEEKREVHPSDWLPDEEYQKLSDIQKLERAQIALDRYVSGPKSKWEVGRDYELYVGYLFRKKGWSVIQNGVTAKLEDMGRDLICHKDGVTLIVQCKFWSQNKEIHEKHITQLLGTTLAYAVEHNLPRLELGSIGGEVTHVIPVFVTSTRLSETAQRFADALHVLVRVIDFDPRTSVFPRIKCNIGKEGKIFHLPFDQMYDRAFMVKALAGKEWMIGKNVFNISAKYSVQGGLRYTPIDVDAMRANIAAGNIDDTPIYKDNEAFTKRFKPTHVVDLTVSYKINKKRVSHTIAFEGLNVLESEAPLFQRYDLGTNQVRIDKAGISLPNIFYRLDF